MNIRNLQEKDVDALRQFINQCKPLEFHTPFTYWVIAKYFSNTSFIVEAENKIIGYATALRGSVDQEALYLWQIGIAESYRGKGLFQVLVQRVIEEGQKIGCKRLQFSMLIENSTSYKAFSSFAERNKVEMKKIDRIEVCDTLTNFKEEEFIFEYKI